MTEMEKALLKYELGCASDEDKRLVRIYAAVHIVVRIALGAIAVAAIALIFKAVMGL